MNAYTTETYDQSYTVAPPVLIAGDSDAALDRAARTVEAAGARIGAILPLSMAPPIELRSRPRRRRSGTNLIMTVARPWTVS